MIDVPVLLRSIREALLDMFQAIYHMKRGYYVTALSIDIVVITIAIAIKYDWFI